jgi:hypothetical protein
MPPAKRASHHELRVSDSDDESSDGLLPPPRTITAPNRRVATGHNTYPLGVTTRSVRPRAVQTTNVLDILATVVFNNFTPHHVFTDVAEVPNTGANRVLFVKATCNLVGVCVTLAVNGCMCTAGERKQVGRVYNDHIAFTALEATEATDESHAVALTGGIHGLRDTGSMHGAVGTMVHSATEFATTMPTGPDTKTVYVADMVHPEFDDSADATGHHAYDVRIVINLADLPRLSQFERTVGLLANDMNTMQKTTHHMWNLSVLAAQSVSFWQARTNTKIMQVAMDKYKRYQEFSLLVQNGLAVFLDPDQNTDVNLQVELVAEYKKAAVSAMFSFLPDTTKHTGPDPEEDAASGDGNVLTRAMQRLLPFMRTNSRTD